MVGSSLIGQGFSSPGYFRPRPSAAGTGYDAANSGGSQFGPTNKKLIDAVKANVEAARQENPGAVPIDLVTTSASGFDPHISPAAAAFQLPRVARERGIAEADVRRLVEANTANRQLGFFGEPGVNVLESISRSMRWPRSRSNRDAAPWVTACGTRGATRCRRQWADR